MNPTASFKVDPENFKQFDKVYREEFQEIVAKEPEKFAFIPKGLDASEMKKKVDQVSDKMLDSIKSGAGFNHDGPVMKATCKKLKIKPTRKAILEFLQGGDGTPKSASDDLVTRVASELLNFPHNKL